MWQIILYPTLQVVVTNKLTAFCQQGKQTDEAQLKKKGWADKNNTEQRQDFYKSDPLLPPAGRSV